MKKLSDVVFTRAGHNLLKRIVFRGRALRRSVVIAELRKQGLTDSQITELEKKYKMAVINVAKARNDEKHLQHNEQDVFGGVVIAAGYNPDKIDALVRKELAKLLGETTMKKSELRQMIREEIERLDEPVNEGIITIALGVAAGLLLVKIFLSVVASVLKGAVWRLPLPPEKLLSVWKETMTRVMTKGVARGDLMVEILALNSHMVAEIKAGRITTIKQMHSILDKAQKGLPVKESLVREAIRLNEAAVSLECQECGKKFKKAKPSSNTKCPKCGSYDVDLAY